MDFKYRKKTFINTSFLPNRINFIGSDESSLFYDYVIIKEEGIKKKTIDSLIPLYTGLLSKEDAEVIVRWITDAHYCGEGSHCNTHSIPSIDLEVSYFKPVTYWRGPVWIYTNWMIWYGF